MTTTELKQRIAELSPLDPFNDSKTRELLKDCLSHIEEQEQSHHDTRQLLVNSGEELRVALDAKAEAETVIRQLQSKLTALEKERDELRFKLKTYAMFRLRCDACGDLFNDHHQGEGCPGAFYKNCGGTLQFNLPEAVREERDQLRADCAAKIDREELRQTVDLLDRMQVTGKVNHEKLQAELLRLESLLNPKGIHQ